MQVAEAGIADLQKAVDTLIIIPNQNLFRVANEKTTFADAFAMADQVLYSGVACITDLMVKEGLINLDFADVRSIMSEMGKAMMGTGEAAGDKRAVQAAEAAIANPLLDETSMRGARGLLISITGGNDLTLYEVDEAASRIRQEVDEEANIILGATFDSALDGVVRVSVVATGIDQAAIAQIEPVNFQPRTEAMARPRVFAPLRSAPRPPADVDAASASASAGYDVDIQPARAGQPPSPNRSSPAAKWNRGFGAGGIHSACAGAADGARGPHAANRGLAAGGAEPDPRHARSSGRLPAPETRRRSLLEKLAAFGITRHEEEPAPAPVAAAAPPPVAPLHRPPPVAPAQADLGRPHPRQQPHAPGRRRSRPARSARSPPSGFGRRSSRNPGVPAPAAQLIRPAAKPCGSRPDRPDGAAATRTIRGRLNILNDLKNID